MLLLGAVAVPLNEELSGETLEEILNRTQPKLVLASPSFKSLLSTKSIRTVVFASGEDSALYGGSFSELLAEYTPIESFPDTSEDQDAVILFTSGSTGIPKGVVLSHGSLFRSARIMDREYGWRSNDVFIGAGALHTMSGLRNPCLAAVHSGVSVVIPGKQEMRNPIALMNLCIEYGVTLLNAGPAFLAFWNRASQKAAYFKSHGIRMVLCTGSALHPVHREAFEKLFECPVYDYYGLTETSGICILINNDLDGIREKGIGRPVGCLLKIVSDTGQSLPAGSIGELAIYSENLMTRYLGDPALTAKRKRDGWFYTGDQAMINASGCVILFGRRDRMLIDKNGENFYPDQIERAINQISGVIESFVTSYTDANMMDHIAALVVLKGDDPLDKKEEESRIRSELLKQMSSHHVPALFLMINEIPKGSSGKVSPDLVQQCILKEIAKNPAIGTTRGLRDGSRGSIPKN